jgi:hypothetical protein
LGVLFLVVAQPLPNNFKKSKILPRFFKSLKYKKSLCF